MFVMLGSPFDRRKRRRPAFARDNAFDDLGCSPFVAGEQSQGCVNADLIDNRGETLAGRRLC
jgi:hypothetical protein